MILRMNNLFASIWSSPDKKTQSTGKLSHSKPCCCGESGNLPRWQLSLGMGSELCLGAVAT